MNRYAFALLVGALALAPVAPRAQTTVTVYTFATVDAISLQVGSSAVVGKLVVRGILQGEAAPVDRSFTFYASSDPSGVVLETCARMATLAMEKPGQYAFQVDDLPGYTNYPRCKLSRANL
jgi:hypothetical protein